MNRLDVAYICSNLYAPFAGISMHSLFYNNKDMEEIVVYILSEDLQVENRDKFVLTVSKYKRRIVFLDSITARETLEKIGMSKYRGSQATNMKFFLPEMVKPDVEYLLYLDSDTIVMNSLKNLFENEIKENVLAMVQDSLAYKHKRYIGHAKDEKYFNAGVILFNIKQWKKNNGTEKIINYATKNNKFSAFDQDLFNIVMKNKIYDLGIKYNLQPIHYFNDFKIYNFLFKQDNYYNKLEIDTSLREPIILHTFRFIGQFPWHNNSMHPNAKHFEKYKKISVWEDLEKKNTDYDSLVFRIERQLYVFLPPFIFSTIFKISYDLFQYNANRKIRKNKIDKNI